MAARVSTRISIRWPPADASEPTDTLVLSVGDYYVDLRVLKSDRTIDWALAGQRLVISEDPLKVKFTHPLDSHYVAGQEEEEPDVGEFTKLPNGDDLETGIMGAPHLGGKIMPYEEVWRELDPQLDLSGVSGRSKTSSWILESVDQPSTKGDPTVTKSYYAKAGNFFLALRQVTIARPSSISVSAIRMEWDTEKLSWNTKYKIGNVDGMFDLSQEAADGDGFWKVGDEVKVGLAKEICTVRSIGS
ncbi:uncharacterized protein A1O9_12236 [Exophiala aquamarina CBS 119918]|uniref:Protein HRI1 n=1 Tax=Exophiala aquamarina CBS 119918 TaxID=1182545 RepID=A0A072NVF8_9EURO|nr:uncharacterized protein A1O9_12236 [Exophiala aquamarina CBS 119918]KEF51601.1 hypothetical protein A1O9_12236 [Exophiala aquamarina CBS 119918]